jgi:hypothetical protein
MSQQHVLIAHQRTTDRQHLLLAAGQYTGWLVRALAEQRKKRKRVVLGPAPRPCPRLHTQQQILPHGEPGEDRAVFRHVAQATARDVVRPQTVDALALEANRPDRRHFADDRLDRRRAAGAVAAQQAHDLALADVQGHALQDVALAVIGVKVGDVKHPRRFPDRRLVPLHLRGSAPERRWR